MFIIMFIIATCYTCQHISFACFFKGIIYYTTFSNENIFDSRRSPKRDVIQIFTIYFEFYF